MSKYIEKTGNVAKHFLTIYTVIALLCSGAAFAADKYLDKYLTVETFHIVLTAQREEMAQADQKKQIRSLNNEILDLQIERKYARKIIDRKRIDEKILRKQNQIKNLEVK